MNRQDLKTEVQRIELETNVLIISDVDSYESAGKLISALNEVRKKVVDYWKEPKQRAYEAHKAITEKESEMLRPIDARKKNIELKISEFLTKQRRLQEEAQKKEDEKRLKIEARKKERLARKAILLESEGNIAAAEAVRDTVNDVYVPPVVVTSSIPKTFRTGDGTISQKKEIQVRITDPIKILEAVIKNEIPIGVIEISIPKLKKHIELFQLKNLPGAAIEEKICASFRSTNKRGAKVEDI